MTTENNDFVKRPDGTVINTNNSELDRYIMARQKAAREKQLADKVEKLEEQMSDIKDLLLSIHNRIG